MKIRTRMQPETRTKHILAHAVELAEANGYTTITREQVARAANVSEGLVSTYFEDMQGLRDAVMRYAIRNNVLRIIGQGVVAHDPLVTTVPHTKRIRAIKALVAG